MIFFKNRRIRKARVYEMEKRLTVSCESTSRVMICSPAVITVILIFVKIVVSYSSFVSISLASQLGFLVRLLNEVNTLTLNPLLEQEALPEVGRIPKVPLSRFSLLVGLVDLPARPFIFLFFIYRCTDLTFGDKVSFFFR